MIAALLILLFTALLCLLLGASMRTAGPVRLAGLGGILLALALSVTLEGVAGSGGRVAWPSTLSWLGVSPFSSDVLSAGLGAWCLLLGAFCLLRVGTERNVPAQVAAAVLTIATLYALVHTTNLLAFSVLVLLLVLLAWVFFLVSGEQDARTDRSTLALGLGSLFLIGTSLLVGRTTGGEYDLGNISLSTLTVWPLVLVAAFVTAWLGLLPLTGWSALVPSGGFGTMLHSLLLGVPVVALVLRFQALVTGQAVGATLPLEWEAFMQALGWLGGITCVVSAAGMVVWAGKSRWLALQATFWFGLILWALGLDTPLARFAALVMLLAYGAGRVAVELLSSSEMSRVVSILRVFAYASLAGVPVTPGFIGVWLLGHALAREARPSLAIVVVGAVVLASVGTALHASNSGERLAGQAAHGRYLRWGGILSGALPVLAALLIPLWSPYLERVAAVAGGSPGLDNSWVGLSFERGALPMALLAGGALLTWGLGWLLMRASGPARGVTGVLLPTALERLDKRATRRSEGGPDVSPDVSSLLENSPSPVWWLSLAWLDRGVWGFGSLLVRLASRFGGLMGRLEGRFYLPLALILTLAALLAVTR